MQVCFFVKADDLFLTVGLFSNYVTDFQQNTFQKELLLLLPGLRDLSYEERVKECGVTTLETRRLRGNQIEVLWV